MVRATRLRLRREQATGCPAAWLMKRVKLKRRELRQMISARRPETQTLPVGFSVRPPGDAPQRQVAPRLLNFVGQLKLFSVSRFFPEKQSALAMQPPRRLLKQKPPVP